MTLSPERVLFPLVANEDVSKIYASRVTEAELAAASFLDERSVSMLPRGVVVDWIEAESLSAPLPEALDFIFHIGHVGSTLLSRLLGHAPDVVSLREPGVLRNIARVHVAMEHGRSDWDRSTFEARLTTLLRLWSQTFRREQRTLLKATSFVSEMAAHVLMRLPDTRSIMMRVAPESYLATILAGEGSRMELRALAPYRHGRLRHRLGLDFGAQPPASEGALAGMSWACEAMALEAAATAAPDRTMNLDFDAFLLEPREALAASLRFLGKDASATTLNGMMQSPDFYRYSKAPEHAYDAQLRRDVLDQARREHRDEIARGLSWLDEQAQRFPALADTVSASLPNSAIVVRHQMMHAARGETS